MMLLISCPSPVKTQHNTLLHMLKPFLKSPQSRGLCKKDTGQGKITVSVSRRKERRNPQLRGETSASLMRRTAVRESSSSLRLWCLSMIHSMIQNILKYRTVITSLQNTHVLGIYILNFFRGRGSCLPWKQSCVVFFFTFWHRRPVDHAAFFFTLSNDDRQSRIIILIQHCYLSLRLIMLCLHM